MPRKGENIYKRKDGRWEGRFIRQKISGIAKYSYVYGKSYSEVKKKLELKKTQCYQRTNVQSFIGQDILFKDICILWLEDIKSTLKESSYIRYSNIISTYIILLLGDIAINDIDYALLSSYVSELLSSGGTKGEGLSSKTVADILSVIKSILKYASRCKYEVDLSAMNVYVKQKNTPVKTLEVADYKRLIEYLLAEPNLLNQGILICAFTGIRIGELCALTWEDFSFDKKIIHVHKTMQRLQIPNGDRKTTIQITAPKSQCSVRDIPIPEFLIPYLNKLENKNAYILSGNSFNYVEPRTMQNHFKRILKQCNIENVNFHVLRHSFATRCIELGFDIKSLSEILGHANVNITLNRYVHPSMELKKKNMSKLSNLFTVK